jgi:SAM-dependent methyltransferase
MKRLLTLSALYACAAAPAKIPVEPAGPTAPAAPAAPIEPVAATPPPAAPTLDEAAVKAKSHEFFDALDRADVSAFQAVASPSFVLFERERYLDATMLQHAMEGRNAQHSPVHSRTWKEERVYLGASSAVFIGHAVVHFPAEGEGNALDFDGFETLVWVRDGGAWKVTSRQFVKKITPAEFWDDTFRAGYGFKTEPNQTLVDAVKGVKPGTALDLSMGQGRNAIHLASLGWKTTGVDISREGLRIAKETADKKKLKLEAIDADVEKYDLGKNKWDLVTMIYAGANEKLVDRIKPSLKKGGLFVTEYFHSDSDAAKGGAGGWKTGQLKALFGDGYEILRDDVVDDIADYSLRQQKLVRFVARKK